MADWADMKADEIIAASDPELYPHSIRANIATALRDAYEAGKAEAEYIDAMPDAYAAEQRREREEARR